MPEYIELRDGSVVADKQWDALFDSDPRSGNWLVDLDGLSQPENSKTWAAPLRLDQGVSGGCVGFAFANLLAAEPILMTSVDYDFALKRIYFEAQKIDRWPGGEYVNAKPFSSGTSVLAAAKVMKRDGFIAQYRWADTIEAMSLAVSYIGPIVIGVDWYQSMKEPDNNGFIQPQGKLLGRHCITVIANYIQRVGGSIDRKRSYFSVLNPAQSSWGLKGVGFLSHSETTKLLTRAEVCVPISNPTKSSTSDISERRHAVF